MYLNKSSERLTLNAYSSKHHKQACLGVMERFKTGYLDLFLIHWPGAANDSEVGVSGGLGGGQTKDPHKGDKTRLETWRALEHLYERGLVRYIGVSNFTEEHLEGFLPQCVVVPHVNQVCDPVALLRLNIQEYKGMYVCIHIHTHIQVRVTGAGAGVHADYVYMCVCMYLFEPIYLHSGKYIS